MNDYEKLVELTKNKHDTSLEFLYTTKNIKEEVEKNSFEDIYLYIEKRQEMIDSISLLDKQFISLFESLKKQNDFEQNIIGYPKLKEYIQGINENFVEAHNIDKEIMPKLKQEYENIQKDMKKIKNQATVTDKYSQDMIKKLTGANFGVFIDEMK